MYNYIPPFCHGCNTYWQHSWVASYSIVHRCQGWCSDGVSGQGSSQWYQALEKPQTPHCRSHNSTDHLSTEKENINIFGGVIETKKNINATYSIILWPLIWTNRLSSLTKGPGHCQKGNLVNDCTPPHRTIMGKSGPLPHNTVHPRFLHDTTITRKNASS